MTRISDTTDAPLILDTEEGSLECPAAFGIEGGEYPAEPYSWGGSRGTEIEIGAELLAARFGGLTLSRDMVEAIIGKDNLRAQEDAVADAYADAVRTGGAA